MAMVIKKKWNLRYSSKKLKIEYDRVMAHIMGESFKKPDYMGTWKIDGGEVLGGFSSFFIWTNSRKSEFDNGEWEDAWGSALVSGEITSKRAYLNMSYLKNNGKDLKDPIIFKGKCSYPGIIHEPSARIYRGPYTSDLERKDHDGFFILTPYQDSPTIRAFITNLKRINFNRR